MRGSFGIQLQRMGRRDFVKKSARYAVVVATGLTLPVLNRKVLAANPGPNVIPANGSAGDISLKDKISQLQRIFDALYVEGEVDKTCEEIDAMGWLHHGHYFGIPGTREGHRQFIKMMRKAFPDGRVIVDNLAEEEDRQVRRLTFTGTHAGELRCPWFDLPPTNSRVTITSNTVCRMEGERVAEEWEEWNTLETLVQLGVLPKPPYDPASQNTNCMG